MLAKVQSDFQPETLWMTSIKAAHLLSGCIKLSTYTSSNNNNNEFIKAYLEYSSAST